MPVNRVPITEIEGGLIDKETGEVVTLDEEEQGDPLLDVPGVTESNIDAVRAVLESESEDVLADLQGIDGIGEVTAAKIVEANG